MMPDSGSAPWYTDRRRRTLRAVCETLLEPGIDVAPTLERVERLIASLPDERDRARLGMLLDALDSRLVNALLGGRLGKLADLLPARREQVLSRWAVSRSPLLRAGFQALKRLTHVAHYCWPDASGTHPAWRAVGYPGPLRPPPKLPEPLPTLEIEADATLECDAVVCGSGAGGGVVAGVLAAAGLDVIVLEKGPNPRADAMTQVEGDMLGALYLDGGLLMTQNGSMPVLAGSSLGGGTVINYTTSFALPEAVRREWDERSGLTLYSSNRFADSLSRVSQRLALSTTWSAPGARDQLLERGCAALGWHVDAQPRNVTDCRQGLECGYCGYGCRHGAKNSTERTYLRDAAQAGARLVVHCEVERVLVERGTAVGVEATQRRGDGSPVSITVRARHVVAACGAIHTPALLSRSGLTNPNIGRGLLLHPASAVAGVFPERVEPWSGSLQTRYSDELADLDHGYGVRFETAPVHFALPASAFGWESPAQFRADLARLSHISIVGVLLRDRVAGRVALSPTGRPRVHYDVAAYDAVHVRRGVMAAAQILAAGGATEIFSVHSPPARGTPEGPAWLDRFMTQCDRSGYRRCRMSYVSFHQMGTASLGADSARSVAGETGEAHEVRRLYVADASAFPASSGVNPMITIMAIADHVARSIVEGA